MKEEKLPIYGHYLLLWQAGKLGVFNVGSHQFRTISLFGSFLHRYERENLIFENRISIIIFSLKILILILILFRPCFRVHISSQTHLQSSYLLQNWVPRPQQSSCLLLRLLQQPSSYSFLRSLQLPSSCLKFIIH